MKNLTLFSLLLALYFNGFSQTPQLTLAENELKGSVKKASKKNYYYHSTSDGYIVSTSEILEFNTDGNLQSRTSFYSILGSTYYTDYTYKSKELSKSTYKTIKTGESKPSSESQTNYKYSNGKLTNLSGETNSSSTTFEYDSKGRWIKEITETKEGKKTNEKTVEYKDDNNYSITSHYYTDGVKSTNPVVQVFQDGKIYSSTSSYNNKTSVYSYSYNDQGDEIKYYSNGELLNETFYVYDKYGNWTEKIKKSFNSYSKNYSYQFDFRQITYKNEVTGSDELKVATVKKYETRDSYEIKEYKSASSLYENILLNPTEVKEIHVMKTEGSKFKVKTDEGNYLTNHVKAIKHTNGLDMILYHANSGTTALMKDFNSDLFRQEIWQTAEIISTTDSIFWAVNEKGNWYIIDKAGVYDKYDQTKLKYSTTNPDDVIVYVNDVATYLMKNYKNATHHKLYALRKL